MLLRLYRIAAAAAEFRQSLRTESLITFELELWSGRQRGREGKGGRKEGRRKEKRREGVILSGSFTHSSLDLSANKFDYPPPFRALHGTGIREMVSLGK